MNFPVYTPMAGRRWSNYRAAAPVALFVWLLWLWRGLWWRAKRPRLGRAVTVVDMVDEHPMGSCLCRRSGVLTTYRGKQPGVQFCQRMLEAFKTKNHWRCANTKAGPRWLAGWAPEEMVGTVARRQRGG
jgi:hypothetical protein